MEDTTTSRGLRPRRPSRRVGWLGVLAVLPLIISCTGPSSPSDANGPPPAGMGAIAGTVVRGPVVPVSDTANTAPVAGAKVIATSSSGKARKEATTDAAGRYQLFVSPGTYVVTLDMQGVTSTRDLPATVVVGEGQTTVLNVQIDTGIR